MQRAQEKKPADCAGQKDSPTVTRLNATDSPAGPSAWTNNVKALITLCLATDLKQEPPQR